MDTLRPGENYSATIIRLVAMKGAGEGDRPGDGLTAAKDGPAANATPEKARQTASRLCAADCGPLRAAIEARIIPAADRVAPNTPGGFARAHGFRRIKHPGADRCDLMAKP